MKNWRPIETAPKDGRRILLYEPYPDEEDQRLGIDTGWWDDSIQQWDYDLNSNKPDDQIMETSPTHWMPLPAPPKI